MVPLDLKELFGGRCRLAFDESAEHEPGGRKNPWYYVIPGRHGSIYPFSDVLLAFHCTARGIRTRLSREHPEIGVRNWSDDGEAIFLFRPDQIDLVAGYVRPRRKRRLSLEHRKKLVQAGAEALESYRKSNSNCDQMAPESANAALIHTSGRGGGF